MNKKLAKPVASQATYSDTSSRKATIKKSTLRKTDVEKKASTHKKCSTASYQEYLIESLKNREEAIAYLNAALIDEDERVFFLALKNVLEAQGCSVAELSRKTNLNRENLHRMLSRRGNPKIANIRLVLHAIGFELAIQPMESK